jgi:hypothetical protein
VECEVLDCSHNELLVFVSVKSGMKYMFERHELLIVQSNNSLTQ